MALVNMAEQFNGLPMDSLIGGPLKAACDSQVMLAKSTANFIREVGFVKKADGTFDTRTVSFNYTRQMQDKDGNIVPQKMELNLPALAIVNVPNLQVEKVDIVFDMEVKSAEASTESNDLSVGFGAAAKFSKGPFSIEVNVNGKVSTHKENTRKSDNSAKYHVELHAKQYGMPEGLSRALDIIANSAAPKATA